jgi:hypothetical protein
MKRVVVLLALLGAAMQANNLQITNLSVNWAAQTVTFDISWENGWRLTTPSANRDAAGMLVGQISNGPDFEGGTKVLHDWKFSVTLS